MDEDFGRGERAVQQLFNGARQGGAGPREPDDVADLRHGPVLRRARDRRDARHQGRPEGDARRPGASTISTSPIAGLYGVGNCVASASARAYWAGGATLGPIIAFAYRAASGGARGARQGAIPRRDRGLSHRAEELMAASTETMADEQRSPSRSSNQLMRNVAFAHQWAAQRQASLVRVRVAIVDAPGGPRACAPTARRSSGSSSLTCAVASGLCHTSGSPICWTYTMRVASLHGCEAGSRPHDGDRSQQHRPPSRRGPWPHSGGLELTRLVSRLWELQRARGVPDRR